MFGKDETNQKKKTNRKQVCISFVKGDFIIISLGDGWFCNRNVYINIS